MTAVRQDRSICTRLAGLSAHEEDLVRAAESKLLTTRREGVEIKRLLKKETDPHEKAVLGNIFRVLRAVSEMQRKNLKSLLNRVIKHDQG